MRRTLRRRRWTAAALPSLTLGVLATLAGLLPAAPAAAQTASPAAAGGKQPSGDTYGWHVVRAGETLSGITERYLGDRSLWRENWRLNPDIADPDLLQPGQRLRVILSRSLPPRSAAVEEVGGRVEQKPHPEPWIPALAGDLLTEEDGVRTYARSSAGLRFDDGARLRLTEGSLVFLRRLGQSLTGELQDQVEIVDGQADLTLRRGERRSDVEIVFGDATARPRPGGGSGGVSESRMRREEGRGQMMVYRGAGEVAAAGQAVTVAEGMGTTVPDGAPPTPPERLLPAVRTLAPAAGERFPFANPPLRWRPVPGAASYRVEVCRDADCARLVQRSEPVEGGEWLPPPLPAEPLFWRVTATAPSGLDGYVAPGVSFVVDDPRSDVEPPVIAFLPQGEAAAQAADRVRLGDGGALRLALHDDVAGVEKVELRWDGGAWTVWGGGAVTVPRGGGEERVLEVRARDRAGRVGERRVTVVRGGERPEAPTVRRSGGG